MLNKAYTHANVGIELLNSTKEVILLFQLIFPMQSIKC